MILSTKQILINSVRQKKGYGTRKLIAEFPNKTLTLSGLIYRIRKSSAAGSVSEEHTPCPRKSKSTDV